MRTKLRCASATSDNTPNRKNDHMAKKVASSRFDLFKDLIVNKLGASALERVNEYRLCAWLGQQEDHHRIVLYQCENKLTPWTRRCMRQADCLLIVGLASNKATVGQVDNLSKSSTY